MLSIVLTARPSYAKLKPLIRACVARGLPVDIVACGAALVGKFGLTVSYVTKDFPDVPLTEIASTLEDSTLATSAKETGILLQSLADQFARTKPRAVLVMADRHETLAASIAASYQNIPVVHLQGGEQSGNIDDRVRDANSALATYHFPATAKAATRLRGFVANPLMVWNYGCPSIDLAAEAVHHTPLFSSAMFGGVGPSIDLTKPFVLLIQHSETEHPLAAHTQMNTTLDALEGIELPVLAIWPGQDAGQEGAAKALRERLGRPYPQHTLTAVRGIEPLVFLRLLKQATVLVGNSSAGIREAGFLRTPVVDIGTRQRAREGAPTIVHVPTFDEPRIREGVHQARLLPPALSSVLYGTGDAAPRIIDRLHALELFR